MNQKVVPQFCILYLLPSFFFLKVIEILHPSAVKMSLSPASLLCTYLSPAVQQQPIHHADSFPPSILPLLVLSELVMNSTDFFVLCAKKRPAATLLTKWDQMVDLRTSWGIRYANSLELSRFLEGNLYNGKKATRFGMKFGKRKLFSPYLRGEICSYLIFDVSVTSDSREGRKTPGITLGIANHVTTC